MTDASDERMAAIREDLEHSIFEGESMEEVTIDLLAKVDEQATELKQLRGGKRIQEQADEVVRQRAGIRQAMRSLVSIEQENYAIECPSYEINIAIKALGEVYGE